MDAHSVREKQGVVWSRTGPADRRPRSQATSHEPRATNELRARGSDSHHLTKIVYLATISRKMALPTAPSNGQTPLGMSNTTTPPGGYGLKSSENGHLARANGTIEGPYCGGWRRLHKSARSSKDLWKALDRRRCPVDMIFSFLSTGRRYPVDIGGAFISRTVLPIKHAVG
jgi:hypothetical protein